MFNDLFNNARCYHDNEYNNPYTVMYGWPIERCIARIKELGFKLKYIQLDTRALKLALRDYNDHI